ncbi:sortase A [Aequitasia blattaphilus]|uniref:Class C sortase n=1 Tax=Aequitasia blattaphilus TaxID=2949332 RepID=A0ABT1ECA7_9FIRM|nr:class C sortase [Aequitasia blattaphilus]MCP1103452.1 class C sortase [Aequitasia blattaphilus]MCR8616092.1 class C sortase [Aequitasia blattaphilus]
MKSKKWLVGILFLIGLGLLMYPVISGILASMQEEKVIAVYENNLDKYTEEEVEKELALAKEYNASISGEHIKDPFIQDSGMVLPDNYSQILDFNGVMGSIEIPKIKVNLPIYHGTSEEVLEKGAGHLLQSSFPVGGDGTHSVISGHRGLPKAKLFTDLVDLEEGDIFYIHILNDVLKYEVDRIETVEPYETENLLPVPGEDYVTLVTCTPYGVNSHRLLVRGTRVPYDVEHTQTIDNSRSIRAAVWWPYIAAAAALVILGILIFFGRRRSKGNGRKKR